MTSTFLFGFIGVVFALAALIIISDVLERKRRDRVRVIVNARPPWLYDTPCGVVMDASQHKGKFLNS
jgi:hypothetical protein